MPKGMQRYRGPGRWDREAWGGGAMTAGLLRASGGMACPELHSHQAGADVFASGSPHPQPAEP